MRLPAPIWITALLAGGLVSAQEKPATGRLDRPTDRPVDPSSDTVLTFTGAPLKLSFPCVDDDLQWAGLSCVEDACPIYTELVRADGRGNTVMITGDFHAANATVASLLLVTGDAGHTWREPSARMRGVALDGVQMYDAQIGWVSGQSMQPIALDPFFLLTTDGGKTWDRVRLFEEEGTPGTIVQFAFSSKDHGIALVDRGGGTMRYEVYESDTGGRSWSMKENSGTLPKLSAPQPSDWRMTPAPKIFRLEHNEGGRWSPFASFAVTAASCRMSAPADLPEPGTEAKPESKPEATPPQ